MGRLLYFCQTSHTKGLEKFHANEFFQKIGTNRKGEKRSLFAPLLRTYSQWSQSQMRKLEKGHIEKREEAVLEHVSIGQSHF